MGKNIKIAFITSSLTAGGAQENLLYLSESLSKKYTVHVISLRNYSDYSNSISDKYKIVSFINRNNYSKIAVPFIALKLLLKLTIHMRNEKYDLLIGAHEYYPFYVTILYAKLFSLRSLLLVGNNLHKEFRHKKWYFSFLHKYLILFSYRQANKIVCVSKGLAADLKKTMNIPTKKLRVIYNGIDRKTIKRLSKEKVSLPLKENDIAISIIGRLIPKKGHAMLIKAFAIVHRENPKTKLLIIGKGPAEKELKHLAKELHLTESIVFLGFVKDNPYKYISSSSLFVCSSLYEGFGNVIIEAMACGLPIICTNVPYGPSEILNNSKYVFSHDSINYGRYGVLTTIKKNESINYLTDCGISEKNLAESIITLLNDKKKRLFYKKMSLERVKFFTSDKMCKLHDKVIQKMMNEK